MKLTAISLFTGAMGLDIGLEKAGVEILAACEIDKVCRETISRNRPGLKLFEDVWSYSAQELLEGSGLNSSRELDLLVGGPPCQSFSTAGARRGLNDSRGNAILRFVQIIIDLKPRFAVIENVRGILSAPLKHVPHAQRSTNTPSTSEEVPGSALLKVIDLLERAGYKVSFNLYNTANFGTPQSRERVVILCTRDELEMPYLMPTHSNNVEFGLPDWRNLRDAFTGLEHIEHEHAEFPSGRLQYYRMLQEGQYWKHLPKELQRAALGQAFHSGGGKTGFYRRLAWSKPSCTLVTSPIMPATDICHPDEDRPLSVQEYKRIQEFPDDWDLAGSLSDKYRQVGNAVPVGLGLAIGKCIVNRAEGKDEYPPNGFPFSRYKGTDHRSWKQQVEMKIKWQSLDAERQVGRTELEPMRQLSLFE